MHVHCTMMCWPVQKLSSNSLASIVVVDSQFFHSVQFWPKLAE